MIPYLVDELGHKRVVLIYVDDPLGESVREELDIGLRDAGGELVEAMSIPVNAQQFSGIAARVRSARPDVVYIASYGAQQGQLIKQLRDNGVEQLIASYSGIGIPEIFSLTEAEGTVFTSQSIDWDSEDPITRRFVDDYKDEYGERPSSYTANYYNATLLFADLAAALEADGREINGENLLEQRLATETFNLVGGEVSFEEDGTLSAPIQINKIQEGSSFVVDVVSD